MNSHRTPTIIDIHCGKCRAHYPVRAIPTPIPGLVITESPNHCEDLDAPNAYSVTHTRSGCAVSGFARSPEQLARYVELIEALPIDWTVPAADLAIGIDSLMKLHLAEHEAGLAKATNRVDPNDAPDIPGGN